ncbi:DUF2975 domain-containing protein [Alkaliphilus pronyensis]|nr:DUF2975 domain-containing protein [Alkaliphilus pronyensis]
MSKKVKSKLDIVKFLIKLIYFTSIIFVTILTIFVTYHIVVVNSLIEKLVSGLFIVASICFMLSIYEINKVTTLITQGDFFNDSNTRSFRYLSNYCIIISLLTFGYQLLLQKEKYTFIDLSQSININITPLIFLLIGLFVRVLKRVFEYGNNKQL